jgi:hypothetical protein
MKNDDRECRNAKEEVTINTEPRRQSMEYIRYIDRTHEYYRSQGYEKSYNYAHNEDIPFTPLEKPLSECRVSPGSA